MKKTRLIDATALESDLRQQYDQVFGAARRSVSPDDFYINRHSAYHANVVDAELNGFFEYLKARPTVDAVPVVRCKDCKYFKTWPSSGGWCLKRTEKDIEFRAKPNDFCVWGKRRCDNG